MRAIIILLVLFSMAAAEWVDFGISDLNNANLEVVECTATGFVVDITLPGFQNNSVSEAGMTFNSISVPALTPYSDADGAPTLPKASFMAAIPNNPNVSISVEALETPVVFENITPSPMQPIPVDNSYDPVPFTYIPDAYSYGSYPDQEAVFENTGTIRGVNMGRFTVIPFHWDAATGDLTVSPKLRVTVNLGGSVSIDPRLQSRFFTNTYRTLVNSEILGEAPRTIRAESSEPVKAYTMSQARDITEADLLIIAGDDFVDTMMDTFIDAKMDQGYLTAIVAAGSWTETQIKNYIQNAYDTWVLPPSFILFVGDQPELTSFSAPGMYSDNRYVCMDGTSDYQADIFHSRFVTPTSHYPIVEAKILKWQFDPLMDADFWGNVLCAGYFQATSSGSTVAERWFCFTCETVRDTYMNIYGKTVQREYTKNTSASPPYYYRSDLPSAGQMIPSDIVWDGDAAGILSSMNDGVFLVQHRDHGSVSGWGDPDFHISDLAGLTNGDRTPMVMSVNCLTGKFDQDCFAENLFRMDGGAVGVLAATEVSYSYWNDYICYGLYKSFNDEYTSPPPIYTNPTGNYLTGQALMCAKIEMETAGPFRPSTYGDRTVTEWDLFHWFGDPTMDMRTDVPHNNIVAAPTSLPGGSTQATFSITDADGAVENALVCITHDSLWASGLTDAAGSVTLTFDAIGSWSDICWMVTSHNALPAYGVINGVGIEGGSGGLLTTLMGLPHPNPASGHVIFPVTLSNGGMFEITVYDTAGRAVAIVHSGDLESGSHSLTWDTSEVPEGIYMVQFIDPTGSISTGRVVVCK